MCGRYSVLTEKEIIDIREILQQISLRIVRDDFLQYDEKPGEIRPTNKAPVIALRDDGVSFENQRFGIKNVNVPGIIFNARSDTLETKYTFSRLLKAGRCVVPASEFFEWKHIDKKTSIKHYAKDREGNILFFAGLYQDTENGREFVIITKDSAGEMAKIHDRMPVILRANQIEDWLNGNIKPKDLLNMEYDLTVMPCDEDEVAQLSLFDV